MGSWTNYYQILGLAKNASLDEVKKAARTLMLRYHPDKNKDPGAVEKFIEIEEAYRIISLELGARDRTGDLSGKLKKISIEILDKDLFVRLTLDQEYVFGTMRISPHSEFSVVITHGYQSIEVGTTGKLFLINKDDLVWIKDIDTFDVGVSDIGRIAIMHSLEKHSSLNSPSPREFIDLGCKLTVLEKDGTEIFSHEFGSNSYECEISSDGNLILVSTAQPDNSIYFFDLKNLDLNGSKIRHTLDTQKGFWKYKNHSRNGIFKLRFIDDIIEVFSRDNIVSSEREYALYLNGKLLPQYETEVGKITKIKKQKGEEKLQSLLMMINSKERREIIEGLWLLVGFINTKGSLPHYTRIIDNISKLIDTNDRELFDVIWKIIKGIMKKDSSVIDPLTDSLILTVKKLCDEGELLVYLGELGKFNPKWVMNEIPLIKQKLKSKIWNERRLAAFAIGYIGAVNISLVEDVIPQIMEYIISPDKLAIELEQIFQREQKDSLESIGEIKISIVQEKNHMEDATWIRDACIDTIGEIGKNFPKSVELAIPLLEEVSKNAPSPYTVKKAIRAMAAIDGKCKDTFRHTV